MKYTTPFLVSTLLFFFCHKEKIQPTPELVKELVNTLVSGTNCDRFGRSIQGYTWDRLQSVKQTPDGGYSLCGYTGN